MMYIQWIQNVNLLAGFKNKLKRKANKQSEVAKTHSFHGRGCAFIIVTLWRGGV